MASITITCIKITDSGKSAFCRASTKVGWSSSQLGVGYLRPAVGETLPPVGETFTFEGTIEFREMVDVDKATGDVTTRTTTEGTPLKELVLIPA